MERFITQKESVVNRLFLEGRFPFCSIQDGPGQGLQGLRQHQCSLLQNAG